MSFDGMVRRRMNATGETYDEAVRAIAAIDAKLAADIDQGWVIEWVRDQTWNPTPEAFEDLRAFPAALHPLMIAFPPSCVVRSRVPLRVPAPGTVGVVASWIEPSPTSPDGTICVMQKPDGMMRAACLPSELVVVAHWHGWTSERVREALDV